MATVVRTGLFIDKSGSPNRASWVFWYQVEFLRDYLGWTIAGSSNGTVGGMGSDNITSVNSLVSTNSWVVMEPPDGSFQLLWTRDLNENFDLFFNPNSDYIGGGVGVDPTSATNFKYSRSSFQPFIFESDILHLTGETEAPFGFACYKHTLDMTGKLSHAIFPLERVEGFPYAFFCANGDFDESELCSASSPALDAGPPWSTDANGELWRFPILQPRSRNSRLFPLAAGSDDTNRVFRAPLIFGACTQNAASTYGMYNQYKGVSRYANWVGSGGHNNLDTFQNREFILFSWMLFPWDGVTVPLMSITT